MKALSTSILEKIDPFLNGSYSGLEILEALNEVSNVVIIAMTEVNPELLSLPQEQQEDLRTIDDAEVIDDTPKEKKPKNRRKAEVVTDVEFELFED